MALFHSSHPPMLHGPSSRIDAGDTQTDDTLQDGTIGEILRQAKGLANEQVERIVHHQRKHRVRFGEAAIALGMATREDVMRALSQQYRYHYAPNVGDKVERELVVARQPFSDDVESFRDLRSHLMMGVLAADQERRALAVVSADVGDGKTFIAANLAVAFSQLPGGRTLIIDTDMRTPRLHTVFGVDNGAGLSGILAGRAEANVIRPVAELPNLYLMPVGAVPPNPTELLQAPTFAMLMRELVSKFDYVLVDTPAAAHGSDARVIAARCGAALVIGRRNRTRAESLRRLMGHLGKGPAKVAGVVMNDY